MNRKAIIAQFGLSETKALNAFQDRGLISDLCVGIEDIAESDFERAIAWLKLNVVNCH